jgi:hypothetical protein
LLLLLLFGDWWSRKKYRLFFTSDREPDTIDTKIHQEDLLGRDDFLLRKSVVVVFWSMIEKECRLFL